MTSQRIVVGAAGLVLASLIAPPLAVVVVDGLSSVGTIMTTLQGETAWLLLRSIVMASVVTAGAFAVGVPMALLLARTDLGLRRVLWALHGFPLFVPPFLLALGWFHALGATPASRVLFSTVGAVFVLVFALSPIVTFMTAVAAAQVDAAQEEAGRVVAGTLRVLRSIVLPPCLPAAWLGALLVFALAFGELGVTMFLRVPAYPAVVLTQLAGAAYAPQRAAALALPIVIVVAILFAIERHFALSRRFVGAGAAQQAPSKAPLPLERARPAATVLAWIVSAFGAIPLLALAHQGWRGLGGAWAWIDNSASNGLVASMVAASIVVACAIPLAHAALHGSRVAAAVDRLVVMAFVMPPSIVGLGLIVIWNRSATHAVYASLAIVIIAFVARYAALGLRFIATTFARAPSEVEDAARTFGATYLARIGRIVVPMHRRGLVGAWLIVVVFCLRDLETPVLLYPPGGEPLTVRIFTLEANAAPSTIAALALVHIAITGVLVAAGATLLRGHRR